MLYDRAYLNDPLSLPIHSALGFLYTKLHRYDDAKEIYEKQAELHPDHHWAYANLGKAYLFGGDAEQALIEIDKNPDNVFKAAGLVLAYTTLGREGEAQSVLQRLVSEYGSEFAMPVAGAYSWRGQKDEAFQALEKAFAKRDSNFAYVLGNNLFYPLKDDPRWAELLRKLNLLEYWQAMPPEYGGPAL